MLIIFKRRLQKQSLLLPCKGLRSSSSQIMENQSFEQLNSLMSSFWDKSFCFKATWDWKQQHVVGNRAKKVAMFGEGTHRSDEAGGTEFQKASQGDCLPCSGKEASSQRHSNGFTCLASELWTKLPLRFNRRDTSNSLIFLATHLNSNVLLGEQRFDWAFMRLSLG